MAMHYRVLVPIPEKNTFEVKQGKGKYTYIHYADKYFRNAKGTPTNHSRSIGKKDADTGMLIPNDYYFEVFGNTAAETFVERTETALIPVQSMEETYEVKKIGFEFAIDTLLKKLGLLSILGNTFGEKIAHFIKIIAIYMLVEGNIMRHIADFCEDTFFYGGLDDKMASSIFASITLDKKMNFFEQWVKIQSQKEYVAYDVTSFSTYSKGIDDAEYGYNRDKESLPQINFAMYIGQTSLLPLFYCTYNGSIIDKSHLKYMMVYNKDFGIEDVGFVMDRGFASNSNLGFMDKEGNPYIIGAELRIDTIRTAFETNKAFVQSSKNYIVDEKVYGYAVKGIYYNTSTYLYIFYDPAKLAIQTEDLFRKIKVWELELEQLKNLDAAQIRKYSRYFEINITESEFTFKRDVKKIDAAISRLGYFFVLSSQDETPENILKIYRKRDVIEKAFNELKNSLDMKRMHTQSTETTDGKMFCAFIALICRMEMQKNLEDYLRKNNISKNSVIRELSKIKCLKYKNKFTLIAPLTKTQREIFALLGISPEMLNEYVLSLNCRCEKECGD